MHFLELIKRAVPFFMTFVIGLFIASFFITLAIPKVELQRVNRAWGTSHSRSHCRLIRENRRLKRKIRRLKREKARNERRRRRMVRIVEIPAPPPPAPVVPRR